MKKVFALSILFLSCFTQTALAYYEGPSGTTYQYDLNNATDRMNYSIDTGAQIRDQVNPSPGRHLDNSLGRSGGGLFND